MLFCHFDEKNSKKTHSKLLNTFFCFYQRGVFFYFTGTRTRVSVTNMFNKAEYKKPIFQRLKSKVLFDRPIGTKGQVFCITSPLTSGHLYIHRNK